MAEIEAVVLKNVQLFLDKLRKTGFLISEAYIFGSYATGNADKWSDIDVAIISPQIGNDRFEERIRLTELAVSIDVRLEPLPFNPDSFTIGDPFVQQIKTEGIAVA
ncbi:MAG: nucleotidyltransferase domain-containing protein [Candidatus Fermentibacteria bacterium]|nr:nucleotidyltransferase domain-containing protein [Candidatus Fermentibacteria bacterium]